MQDGDVLEVIVSTSNNVSKALMLGRRMEKISLKHQLDDIARQQKKSRLFIERHKQAFLQTYKVKRKDWWKYDTHVRDNVRRDFDSVIINKVQEISSRSQSVNEESKKKSPPRKLLNSSPKSDGDADSEIYHETMLITDNHHLSKTPKSLNNSINQTISESEDEKSIPSFNYFAPKKQVKDNQVMAYFKPNISKLPEIKGSQSLRKLSQTLHETPTDTFQTKSIIYQNERVSELSNINKNKNKRNSIKPDGQQQLQQQLKLPKLTLKEASLSRFGMNTVSLTNVQRSEFINQMKSHGDLNDEDEAFFDVLTRFLKRSPFYVESKDKIRAIELERYKTMKSILKEKKVSQTRDKRFDNLMRSLVDTNI